MKFSGISHITRVKNAGTGRNFPLTLERFLLFYLFVCAILFIFSKHYLRNDGDYLHFPRPAKETHYKSLRPLKAEPAIFLSSNNEFFKNLTAKFRLHRKQALSQGKGSYKEKLVERTGSESFPNVKFINVSKEFFQKNSKLDFNETEPQLSYIPNNASLRTEGDPNFWKTQAKVPALVIEDFQSNWFRQRAARIDWPRILRPCVNYTRWGRSKQEWGNENHTSASTSYVAFWDIKPAGEFSRIFIQSRTAEGRAKKAGGDFWRVKLRGPSSLDGSVFDHDNGTYEVLFLIMEPGIYSVSIHLDYSLCDGLKEPPDDWFIRGNAQGKYQKEGELGDVLLDEFLQLPFSRGMENLVIPPRRLTSTVTELLPGVKSCSRSCKFLLDGFGRWVNMKWDPYLDEPQDWIIPSGYRPSGTLWIYGDSLAVRLFWSVNSKRLCTSLYSKCHYSYNWIYPVRNEQVEKEKWDSLDFNPERVINTVRAALEREDMNSPDSTLLLNLGLHFTISVNFTAYRKLIDDVIVMMQEKIQSADGSSVPKYQTRIIWKTTTPIDKEKAERFNITRWRFFTLQRIQLYNAYATSAMCDAGYDVIDVYPLAASWPLGTKAGDVVHYSPEVFASVEQMLGKLKLGPDLSHGNNERRTVIKKCIVR